MIDNWKPNLNDIRWVYKRGQQGDIEVCAPTREAAIAIMRAHGFINIDPHSLFPIDCSKPIAII